MGNVFDINRIATAKVMVVGCGALGNEVLKCLAMSGIRHIVVVDYDRVEERNISHSVLFEREDIGMPKVEAAARSLRRRYPGIDLRGINGDIQHHVGLGLLGEMDVVIGCVDNRWARYCINRLCMRAGKMWVDGGIAYLDGTARVFGPGVNCYACSLGPEGLKEIKRHISCADVAQAAIEEHHAPTTILTSSITAAAQVVEAMKIIENKGRQPADCLPLLAGKMLVYDGEAMSVRIVGFQSYDSDCPMHEQWEPMVEVDFSIDTPVLVAMAAIGDKLGWGMHPRIHTTDFSFVDFVEHRTRSQVLQLMCPSYMVEQKLADLAPGADVSEFLTHSYDAIDSAFPYPHLALRQIGFPDQAVLRVTDRAGSEQYVSLKTAS